MLVLNRKLGEKIIINGNIELVVLEVTGRQLSLGIKAPRDIPVHREEVHNRLKQEQANKADNVRVMPKIIIKKKRAKQSDLEVAA